MTDATASRVPHGAPRLAPHLVCRGAAAAITFYTDAFGAREMMRLPGPDGRLAHASMTLNGGVIMLVDEMSMPGDPEGNLANASPKTLGGTPVTIHLTVDDVDAVVARALAAGAVSIVPVQAMFWGDRYGVIEDPFGHRWSIATPGPNAPTTSEGLAAAMRSGGPAA